MFSFPPPTKIDYKSFQSKIPSKWFDLRRNGLAIDGDSMILHLLQLKRDTTNAEFMIDSTYGRPSLHVIFSVRRYLKRLADYAVPVDVVFIKSFDQFYTDDEYLFYRSLVMTDLIEQFSFNSQNISSIQVRVFESVDSHQLQKFLQSRDSDLVITEALLVDSTMPINKVYIEKCKDFGLSIIQFNSFTSPHRLAEIKDGKRDYHQVMETYSDTDIESTRGLAIIKDKNVNIIYLQDIYIELLKILDMLDESDRGQVETLTMKWILHQDVGTAKCKRNLLRSLIHTHFICLCLQSYVSITLRGFQDIPDDSISAHSADTNAVVDFKLSDMLTSYHKIYCKQMLDNLPSLANAHITSVVENCNEDSNSSDGALYHGTLYVGDLWDGRFLATLQIYCLQYGHKQLLSTLPPECKVILLNSLPEGRKLDHESWLWNQDMQNRDTSFHFTKAIASNPTNAVQDEVRKPYRLDCEIVEMCWKNIQQSVDCEDMKKALPLAPPSLAEIAKSSSDQRLLISSVEEPAFDGSLITQIGGEIYSKILDDGTHSHSNRKLVINKYQFVDGKKLEGIKDLPDAPMTLSSESCWGNHDSGRADRMTLPHNGGNLIDDDNTKNRELNNDDLAVIRERGRSSVQARLVGRNGYTDVIDQQTAGWYDIDISKDGNESGTILRERLLAGELGTMFDYIDIGPHWRDVYLLPNGTANDAISKDISNESKDTQLEESLKASSENEEAKNNVIHPEPWQLRMLKVIRDKKSLVVVAPTSSGKTMSAEYAMRMICETTDNSIGCFVLPTNALVNQEYATLTEEKKYMPKIAMFTREKRTKNLEKMDFKVLVTNPQCLELLIMKKGHQKGEDSFFSRLKYVVLDEIHCIGSSGSEEDADGAVLERLLCMLTCPVICLSATLANATEFVSWLKHVKAKSYDSNGEISDSTEEDSSVEVIVHNERNTALYYHALNFRKQDFDRNEVKASGSHLIDEHSQLELTFQPAPCVIEGKWIIDIEDSGNLKDIINSTGMHMSLELCFDQWLNAPPSLYRLTSDAPIDVADLTSYEYDSEGNESVADSDENLSDEGQDTAKYKYNISCALESEGKSDIKCKNSWNQDKYEFTNALPPASDDSKIELFWRIIIETIPESYEMKDGDNDDIDTPLVYKEKEEKITYQLYYKEIEIRRKRTPVEVKKVEIPPQEAAVVVARTGFSVFQSDSEEEEEDEDEDEEEEEDGNDADEQDLEDSTENQNFREVILWSTTQVLERKDLSKKHTSTCIVFYAPAKSGHKCQIENVYIKHLEGQGDRIVPVAFLEVGNQYPEVVHINLNPLCFLSDINFNSNIVLNKFLDASPSMQAGHIVEMFDAFYENINKVDITPLFSSPIFVPDELLTCFNELLNDGYLNAKSLDIINLEIKDEIKEDHQELVNNTDFNSLESNIVNLNNKDDVKYDPHEYVEFRARYIVYCEKMKAVILAQPNVFLRLVLDNMMGTVFFESNLDWYGKLFYLGIRKIDVEVLEKNFIKASKSIHDIAETMIENHKSKHALCTFLKRCVSTLGFYSNICLRSIFSCDVALKYFVRVIMLRSSSEEESLRDTNRTLVLTNLRHTLIDSLIQSNKERKENLVRTSTTGDIQNVSNESWISILRDFMIREEQYLTNSAAIKEAQCPTLIFCFSKKKIKKLLEFAIEKLNMWRGDLPRGSYLNEKDKKRIKALQSNEVSDWQKEALYYGIGIHYASAKQDQAYITLVENLFQDRKLKFVLATGSLSYGINMPASNVIFLGTSPYLDGMLFRQCSGRAGRRGYGPGIGNVYFVGFKVPSIVRKMCMPLDELMPQLPITTSFILRATIMSTMCYEGDREWVRRLVYRTLTTPLFRSLIKNESERHLFDSALMHSCFFSWSFLNERGYVRNNGIPTMKSDLQNRLHYIEPQCFLLSEFFTQCIDSKLSFGNVTLADLVSDEMLALITSENKAKLEYGVLSILDYSVGLSPTNDCNKAASYPLPEVVKTIWDLYMKNVFDQFFRYAYAQGRNIGEDQVISVTHADFGQEFKNWLKISGIQHQRFACARSAFACLSGQGDAFSNITEMQLCVKDGIFVSESIIPAKTYPPFVHKRNEILYESGSFDDLVDWDPDAKKRCEDFSSAIRIIRASIEKITEGVKLTPKAKIVFKMFRYVIDKYERQLKIARGKGVVCAGVILSYHKGGNNKESYFFLARVDCKENYTSRIVEKYVPSDAKVGDVVQYYKLVGNKAVYASKIDISRLVVSKFEGTVQYFQKSKHMRCHMGVVTITLNSNRRVQNESKDDWQDASALVTLQAEKRNKINFLLYPFHGNLQAANKISVDVVTCTYNSKTFDVAISAAPKGKSNRLNYSAFVNGFSSNDKLTSFLKAKDCSYDQVNKDNNQFIVTFTNNSDLVKALKLSGAIVNGSRVVVNIKRNQYA